VNDWYGHGIDDKAKASFYGGPYPPDKEHTYVFTVLALDFVPVLRTGFTREELLAVSKDHVLAKATMKGR
ncbi:MAG: YbhB/YbcL family Raf kinase inhibitor-like protein, partial [archaeon]|nr:YbhB/YbcL family Raf kinase inhibitor-like protein [archaeon]